MKEIKPKEAQSLVDKLGPHISSCDFTYPPVFPKTRRDVCAVRRMAENGSTFGYDTIYLLWRAGDEIEYECLVDSKSSKDYLYCDEVLEDGNDIVAKVNNGSGCWCGWAGVFL